MAENQTYSVGYGDDKRKCKCKSTISSSTLMGTKQVIHGGVKRNICFHAECLFDSLVGAHTKTKVIESKEDLEGYKNLTTKDKSVIDKLIKDFTKKRASKSKGTGKSGVDAVPETKYEETGACSSAKETVKQGKERVTTKPKTKTTPSGTKLPEVTQKKANYEMNRYVTRRSRKGTIIVINNMDFRETRRHGQTGLEDRPGSDKDEERLLETFTGFGFVCQLERNQKGLEIRRLLEEFTKKNNKYKEDDSIIIAVLSHGSEKNGKAVVCGIDGVEVEVDMIINQVDGCSYLKGRPKFFIVQACRGDQINEEGLTADGPQQPIPSIRLPRPRPEKTVITKDGESVAQFSDLVIAQSTWSGNPSYRDVVHGSPYIQTMCDVFKEKAPSQDVMEMMREVNKRMSRWSDHGKKQMPQPTITLTKEWHLLDNEP